MSMVDWIRSIVGVAPPGFEYLEYTFACLICVLFVAIVYSVLIELSKLGKRE